MAAKQHQDFQSHTCSGNVATLLEAFQYKKRDGSAATAKKFRLASNQGDETLWYQVNVFDPRLAHVLEQHVSVGRRVVVNGRLKLSAYAGRDGPALAIQMDAMAVNFMDAPPESPAAKLRPVEDALLSTWALFSRNR